MSRAQREREAKAYRDLLTPAQEVWALRKIGFLRDGAGELAPTSASLSNSRVRRGHPVHSCCGSDDYVDNPIQCPEDTAAWAGWPLLRRI